jgi:hypothetical protein
LGTRPSARQPRRCQPLSLRPADQEIAALARQFDQQLLTGARAIIDALAQRARLRPDISRAAAADTMWLLMDPVVFRRLTTDRAGRPANTSVGSPKAPGCSCWPTHKRVKARTGLPRRSSRSADLRLFELNRDAVTVW